MRRDPRSGRSPDIDMGLEEVRIVQTLQLQRGLRAIRNSPAGGSLLVATPSTFVPNVVPNPLLQLMSELVRIICARPEYPSYIHVVSIDNVVDSIVSEVYSSVFRRTIIRII